MAHVHPKQLLYEMLRIRLADEAIAARYSEQQMRCPVHLSIGQEAVAVGVATALTADDWLFSTHRAHAHYLAKGGSLPRMLAEIHGRATGCSKGLGGSMHLIDRAVGMLGSTPIVGSSLPVAVGAAFAAWQRDESRVTAVFFGEGTTEEGVFAECLNFATLKQLPIVFVCENNLYSVYSPMEVRQPATRDRVAIAQGHGMVGARADGNDIMAVLELASEAIDQARGGGGPAFLEFDTYRWREHCGPGYDNDIGYRSEAEFQSWKQRCPIERLQQHLIQAGQMTAADQQTMREQIQQELNHAFLFATESPFPEPEQLGSYLHAGVNASVAARGNHQPGTNLPRTGA